MLSFFEAIIFPIAPEIMLAPMVLAKPERWARYAAISLVCSMLGALVGYALGHYAFDAVRPVFEWSWLAAEHRRMRGRAQRGSRSRIRGRAFWMLVAAGFVPVPLKVFTWASGIVGMPLLPFIGGMVIGRGKRVLLVAGLIRLGGPKRAEEKLHRWIEPLGWARSRSSSRLFIYFKFIR